MMYFGIEMAISFSPLSTGAGVGPNDLTNIGSLAARPLTNFIQAFSEGKTFSFSPMSQEIVVAWLEGLANNNLSLPFGVCQIFVSFGNILRFDKLLIINQGDIFNTKDLNLIVLSCPFGIDGGRR